MESLEEKKYTVFNKLTNLIVNHTLKQQDIIKIYSGRCIRCEEITLLELISYYRNGYNNCQNKSTSKELGIDYNGVCYYFYALGVRHGNKKLSRIC